MTNQERKSKKRLIEENPLCRMCFQSIGTTLMHKIRKSYSKALADEPNNHSLACLDCHRQFDDYPYLIVDMPGFGEIVQDIKEMDELYYNRLMRRIEETK